MTNNSRLSYLFHAYYNKTASAVERDELMELLSHQQNDGQLNTMLELYWQQFSSQDAHFSEGQIAGMLEEILAAGRESKPAPIISGRKLFTWIKLAAAAALLIFIIRFAYMGFRSKQPVPVLARSEKSVPVLRDIIAPGGNKAMLITSGGSRIVLDSVHEGMIAEQGSMKVVKADSSTLVYHPLGEADGEVIYNTLSTPRGGKYQLILPDGSKVWLNASSSIHFPSRFFGKERNVTVTGETYFEVAKNPSMPFVIAVKDLTVQVLGTHFNIMAYDDEHSLNTTLLEGSVKLSRGAMTKLLVPGQQAAVNNETGSANIKGANTEQVLAWKNGWFHFNEDDIQTVMRQVSRWYDVDIVYEGKIPAGHFSGLVSRDNDISQVLKIMKGAGVQFRIEGRKLIVLA